MSRRTVALWSKAGAPVATDDVTKGYKVGHRLQDSTNLSDIYVCISNTTGSAVWRLESEILRGNSGKVRITGSGGVPPSYNLVGGVEQIVSYGAAQLNLSPSPITQWPQNIITPTDADIWRSATSTLIENPSLGQAHTWRIVLNYSNKALNLAAGLDVFLRNPLSGFIVRHSDTLPERITSKNGHQSILVTIADSQSLPAPTGTGQGYELVLLCNTALTVTVVSVTRISQYHSPR